MKLTKEQHQQVVELVQRSERDERSPVEAVGGNRYRLHYTAITVRLPEHQEDTTRVAFKWGAEELLVLEREAGPGDTLELWDLTGYTYIDFYA
jgi:hypothetical protein